MAEGAVALRQMRRMPLGVPMSVSEPETQCVVVLDDSDELPGLIADMCAALGIGIIHVGAVHELPFRLHHHRPIAVISAIALSGRSSCAVLRGVAAFNPDLPVMMLATEDPASQGAIDAAEQLWGLTAVTRLGATPGPRDLIGFLFHAGRRDNSGRLVPLF